MGVIKIKEIIFTNTLGLDFFPPQPAIKQVPDWYKNTEEYVTDEGKKIPLNSGTPHTIKKCIPVFDAMTAGYILYTQVDVQVTQKDYLPYYSWRIQDPIHFHSINQAPLHPLKNGAPYPKWNNYYSIKTPPGYSTLFLPPMHSPNNIFTIFPGFVDTDKYTNTVNFPFVLNDVKWEGIIEAGTPMAQVIPVKRDSWKQKIGSSKDIKEIEATGFKLKTLFFNSYKKQFWTRKEYR